MLSPEMLAALAQVQDRTTREAAQHSDEARRLLDIYPPPEDLFASRSRRIEAQRIAAGIQDLDVEAEGRAA